MKIRSYKGEMIRFLSLPLKSNQLSLVGSDFHETLQGGSTVQYIQKFIEGIFDMLLLLYPRPKFNQREHALRTYPTLPSY